LPGAAVEFAGVLRPPRAGRLRATTHPRPLPASWLRRIGAREPLNYIPVEPDTVADVQVDTADEHQRWRHEPTFLHLRNDISPSDVPLTIMD
jgi:hypothetical protein